MSAERIKIEADPDEVSVLVERLAYFLVPEGTERVSPGRVFAILQALAISMGATIAAFRKESMIDDKGRHARFENPEEITKTLLDLAEETIRRQIGESLQ